MNRDILYSSVWVYSVVPICRKYRRCLQKLSHLLQECRKSRRQQLCLFVYLFVCVKKDEILVLNLFLRLFLGSNYFSQNSRNFYNYDTYYKEKMVTRLEDEKPHSLKHIKPLYSI
jgi:hypothetical protein